MLLQTKVFSALRAVIIYDRVRTANVWCETVNEGIFGSSLKWVEKKKIF